MEYEEYEDKVSCFKKYAKQTLDLLVDAYRWKKMSKECDDEEMKQRYIDISNMLYDLFMEQHKNMQNIFSNEN